MTTVPSAFVLNLSDEFRPASVRNGLGKLAITYHSGHIEIFKRDDAVESHKALGMLVQEISTLIRYLFVQSSDLDALLLPIDRTFDLTRKLADRGGAQEDDRTGGYRDCANEILTYAQEQNLKTKVIFLNDGPGLLLGSMWNDYAYIENSWSGKILIVTLRMVPERITLDWLRS